jgi:2-haloacid dehalogenase
LDGLWKTTNTKVSNVHRGNDRMTSTTGKQTASISRRAFFGTMAALPVAASGVLAHASRSHAEGKLQPAGQGSLKALCFDMQGTMLNFYDPILKAVGELGIGDVHSQEWQTFPLDWNTAARDIVTQIVAGQQAWMPNGKIYSQVLDAVLARKGVNVPLLGPQRSRLLGAWGNMTPWSDANAGLLSLKNRFVVATLSNASMAAVLSIVKKNDMPFDTVLTAEIAHAYKPDRRAYQLAIDYLGFEPGQIMMVAAHKWDLQGAKACGLRTAYIPRPLEYGPATSVDIAPESYIDVMASGMTDLATRLSAV